VQPERQEYKHQQEQKLEIEAIRHHWRMQARSQRQQELGMDLWIQINLYFDPKV
jgi:hypothetical protein